MTHRNRRFSLLVFEPARATFADLASRRRVEIDAFNANPPETDEDFEKTAETTFLKTEDLMARLALASKADALAAIGIIEEEIDPMLESVTLGRALLTALRHYIERKV